MDLALNGPPLLEAKGLIKFYEQTIILHGIDLSLAAGETLGIVGASGSGKTTLARILARLIEPDQGSIIFDGRNLLTLKGVDLRQARAEFQIIFQDSLGSLNPRAQVSRILTDPLRIHGIAPKSKWPQEVESLLKSVGLPASFADRFPHQLSGGQRQRIAIARAIALRPRLLILDEPVSSLDVTVRGQILSLLKRIQRESGAAYIFISHDLAVVRAMADNLAVMDEGKIVERGNTERVITHPQSTAAKNLTSAMLRLY